jgi:NAD(P)H-dependent FMN reductase/ketosteroid isomerase-like protein
MARAPRHLDCRIVEIAELALYNEDLEEHPPKAWVEFRDALRAADAVLFVTPEYNRSLPGGLKNALDVGSRPPGASVFTGKPAAVVSVTPYKLGAFGANHALRQTFVFLDMPVLQQPEMYLGKAGELLDERGEIKDGDTAKLFDRFMLEFANFIERFSAAPADFGAFMRAREAAAKAYVKGDVEPLRRMLAQADPATFFSPGGQTLGGAKAVAERYAADARRFGPGSTTELEVLQSASGELGFWTGLQHAEAEIDGKRSPMTLRVTEVFRVEDGEFRLVHRHADPVSK